MKLVRESIHHFERGLNPKKSLNIGRKRIYKPPFNPQEIPDGYYEAYSPPYNIIIELIKGQKVRPISKWQHPFESIWIKEPSSDIYHANYWFKSYEIKKITSIDIDASIFNKL